jgi:hypothetical protein
MMLNATDHGVALGSTERAREEFHDPRIGIQYSKCFPILVTPSAQANAFAEQHHRSAHRRVILDMKAKGSGRCWPDRLNLRSVY